MAKQQIIGQRGENEAAAHIAQMGYTILERNWRIGKAEVDIIAKDGEVLVFIEVKAKTYTHFGAPEESVSTHKENLLIDAAGHYMELIGHEWEIRFDIISIIFDNKELPVIQHFKDAFYPSV